MVIACRRKVEKMREQFAGGNDRPVCGSYDPEKYRDGHSRASGSRMDPFVCFWDPEADADEFGNVIGCFHRDAQVRNDLPDIANHFKNWVRGLCQEFCFVVVKYSARVELDGSEMTFRIHRDGWWHEFTITYELLSEPFDSPAVSWINTAFNESYPRLEKVARG
jgi:hypothetical protein